MLFSSAIIVSALCQLGFATAIPTRPQLRTRAAPLPPTEDPFYVAPTGLDAYQPGTILRSRSIDDFSLGGAVPLEIDAAYQLLFRTTDSLGNASAAVTTILIPNNANTSRLLSYQFAEDAAWANCAPSYTIQLESNATSLGSGGLETLFVIAGLDQGWVVNLPDYEGLNSAFTSGIQAGQATLDSVRAALSSGYISTEAEAQMWGYSGGSIASEWAAELQPSYAPELSFIGTAIGGVIPNITSVLYTINEGAFAGLVPAGILGLGSAYPELEAYINAQLIPNKTAEFKQALTQCLGTDIITFAGQNMFDYFIDGTAALNSPISQQILTETGIMGTHGTPQMPLFVYKAVADEVSVVADTDALVAKFCLENVDVQYIRDGLGEHATEEIIGSGDAFQFLIDRFNGVPVVQGCTTTTVLTDLLEGDDLLALGAEVADALLAIVQLPIGDYID